MHGPRGFFLIILCLALPAACGSPMEKAGREPLPEAETFHWSDQPLTFRPPPTDWERQRHNEGGLRGVRFTHSGSVGERIYVAEYYKVGERSARLRQDSPLTLDEVVQETRLTTEGWPFPPDSFVVQAMLPDTVAGVPAYRLDFLLNTPQRTLTGREYYFLGNDHLFEAAYLGLPVNTSLFQRIVESIVFPHPGDP